MGQRSNVKIKGKRKQPTPLICHFVNMLHIFLFGDIDFGMGKMPHVTSYKINSETDFVLEILPSIRTDVNFSLLYALLDPEFLYINIMWVGVCLSVSISQYIVM